MFRRATHVSIVLVLALALAPGCGDDEDTGGGGASNNAKNNQQSDAGPDVVEEVGDDGDSSEDEEEEDVAACPDGATACLDEFGQPDNALCGAGARCVDGCCAAGLFES